MSEINVRWRDIPGYEGIYKVSENGDVVRIFKRTMRRVEKHYRKDGVFVNLSKEKSHKLIRLADLVGKAFIEADIPEGMIYISWNGNLLNTKACDLTLIPIKDFKAKLPKIRHATVRKRIEKVDAEGNVIEAYDSITDAAIKNNYTHASITYKLNNNKQNQIERFGFTFRYAVKK